MKIKRAAIELNWMGITIFGAVVLIFVFFASTGFIRSAGSIGRREVCKRSVDLASIKLVSNLGMLQDTYGNKVQLDCSTEYVDYSDIEDPEDAKKIIADKMVDCWDLYGEGKKDIFDTKQGNYCIVCSRLTFEDELEIKDFTEYLKTKPAPYKGGYDYWTYFHDFEVIDYELVEVDNTLLGIEETMYIDYPLAVMYVMEKKMNVKKAVTSTTLGSVRGAGATAAVAGVATLAILCSNPFTCLPSAALYVGAIGAGAGAIGGGIAGYSIGFGKNLESDAKVMLWNYDNIKDLNCTYMEADTVPLKVIEILR